MDYKIQNISFSIPDNEREENFGLKEWAGNKMLDAMLAAAKNRIGNLNLGDVAGKVIGGDLTPLQDLYDKLMGGNKTESTTQENNTGTNSNSLWTGIVDFIKNHPYLSAGGAALAGQFLSNAMRQPHYGMQMPSYGMGYGMPMPMYQPMMMPNYGYYGNGLSSAITSLAPILAAYGINRFVNSQNKPAATQTPPTELPKDKNEGAQNPDEYARELMEQFPDHYDEIQKSLDNLEKKYKDNWNKINTGLKATAIRLGKAVDRTAKPNESDDIPDGPLDGIRRGLSTIDGIHPIKNLRRSVAEDRLNEVAASHSDEYLDKLAKQMHKEEMRSGKSYTDQILDKYGKSFGLTALDLGGAALKGAWKGVKTGVGNTWNWVKDKYNRLTRPKTALYSAQINLQGWKDKLYKIREV